MLNKIKSFEFIVRRAYKYTESEPLLMQNAHPFEIRNIHQNFPINVKELFDDGHFSQATFEAYKFIDKEVQKHTNSNESGFKLMMQVFGGTPPEIALTNLVTTTDIDEQKGYQFIFAGGMLAIRNPRGHEYTIKDDPDLCLDHLSLASMLLRRLYDAGYK